MIAELEKPTEEIKKALDERHASYVLITCTDTSENGEMEVQMHFKGEDALLSLMLDNASQIFEERREVK